MGKAPPKPDFFVKKDRPTGGYMLHCLDCKDKPHLWTDVAGFLEHKRTVGHRRVSIIEDHETLDLALGEVT